MCENHNTSKEKVYLFLKFLLTAVLFICGFKITICFLFAYLIIGYDILLNSLKNIIKGHVFDECFLMSIATLGAIAIKEFPEAVLVMFLYQIGEFLQEKVVDKSKQSIKSLIDTRANFANKLIDEEIYRVNPEQINIGDIIIVKSGEKIPLDGIIIEGSANVDTSSVTGEFLPKTVTENEKIYSGCINLDGILKIRVTKDFANSTVSKILEMVEFAASQKATTEKFITRFAKIYTPLIVCLAIFIAIIPSFFINGNWIERALTFLVISCPCAFVISVPLTFFAGIGACSKCGILVKGSVYLEKLSNISVAVFDKTGTLTNGAFEVIKINTTNPKILEYAAKAESGSNHPIAKAIKKAYGKKTKVFDIKEFSGLGICANVDGVEVCLGNSNFIKVQDINSTGTVVYVSINGKYEGNIIISDTVKTDSYNTLSELVHNNIKTVMLTGDSYSNAKSLKSKLLLDEFYAELLPKDKVEKLEILLQENKSGNVLFVGDGINDAPVLARADVGIAMGALGSDAAIEAADVVIMDDKLSKILTAMTLGKETMKITYQNIIFAIGIKFLFLILGFLGFMTMWGAIFADVGVTVLTVINSLRILQKRYKK